MPCLGSPGNMIRLLLLLLQRAHEPPAWEDPPLLAAPQKCTFSPARAMDCAPALVASNPLSPSALSSLNLAPARLRPPPCSCAPVPCSGCAGRQRAAVHILVQDAGRRAAAASVHQPLGQHVVVHVRQVRTARRMYSIHVCCLLRATSCAAQRRMKGTKRRAY